MSLNDRAWIRDTLEHREPAAVPYNFMFSPLARTHLEAHYGTRNWRRSWGCPCG